MDIFNTVVDMKERGFHLYDPPLNILNYDPAGDGDDNDALVMVSREEWRRGELYDPDLAIEMIFRVLLAHRFPKGLEFPEKTATILRVNRQMLRWQGQGRQYAHVIGVENNGVGYAMASTLRTKTNIPIIGYTTTGTSTKDKPYEGGAVSMPRLAALDNLRVMTELHRVKIARDCEGKAQLSGEMNSFVWARPGRPEAIEGQHDDLVMALCGAIWIGTKLLPPVTKQVKIDPKAGIMSHNRRLRGNMRLQ